MLVITKTTCPYIAQRNNESIKYHCIFQGKKKECEKFLLHMLNSKCHYSYFENVSEALKFFKAQNTHDGLWRDSKKSLYLSYDSREWMICTKKEFYEMTKTEKITKWNL